MFSSLSLTLLVGALSIVKATPTPEKRASITSLTSSQINAFKSTTFFSAAAYCSPSVTINWSCGGNCAANSGFQPIAAGGDGDDVQFWYVGFDPASSSIVVAHQGTDPSEFEADLTDVDFFLETLDTSLFPGLSSSIEVHNGFQDEQAETAPQILAAVKSGLSKFKTTKVLLTGHSLGAALSLLDSVYLPLHLPSSTTFQTIVYGLPRVGNQAFANYVDAHLHLTHVNNQKDPVPIVPGRFLGFVHPSGEVHINSDGSWSSCPGQDNTSSLCIVGDEPNLFDSTLSNHDGPYNNIFIAGSSAKACTA
ncbi:lipase [Sistotremastrum niveocremeum HHB9708]|uniref:Lipase n=1 Tax=Sistotremastrum niveocremeum HHB9708 TaxID=1314777 RepID=A0A164WZU6_9AGAM|nr:lipase [Sistotremastrum niveocremeum HHB9708]